MKSLIMYLAVILIAGTILAAVLSQQASAFDINKSISSNTERERNGVCKLEADIAADRDRIIEENKAIKADRQKLKEAGKIADKAKAEQVRQELNQDIERRNAAIKDLKRGISVKRLHQHDLIYGKEQPMENRTRQKY